MAKANGIVADFDSLLKLETGFSERISALEAQADEIRAERNKAVADWLAKYGAVGKDRKGRKTLTRKPFQHNGVTYHVLMAYQQSDDAGVKPGFYIRRLSAGSLGD